MRATVTMEARVRISALRWEHQDGIRIRMIESDLTVNRIDL